MILEAVVLDWYQVHMMLADGWREIRREGSAVLLRWAKPTWPRDPATLQKDAPCNATCGWQRSNVNSEPQDCARWPQCECSGDPTKLGRTRLPKGALSCGT